MAEFTVIYLLLGAGVTLARALLVAALLRKSNTEVPDYGCLAWFFSMLLWPLELLVTLWKFVAASRVLFSQLRTARMLRRAADDEE